MSITINIKIDPFKKNKYGFNKLSVVKVEYLFSTKLDTWELSPVMKEGYTFGAFPTPEEWKFGNPSDANKALEKYNNKCLQIYRK